MEVPAIEDFETFIENLQLLEEFADKFVKSHPGKDPLGNVIKYIRTGVNRYNSGSWKMMAGYIDPEFEEFVISEQERINLEAETIEDMITVTSLLDIKELKLPNGEKADLGHMFGTMDIAYNNNFSVNHADVGGWAGDLVDLLGAADWYGVSATTIDGMAAEIAEKYFLKEESQLVEEYGVLGKDAGTFSATDVAGDLDAFYVLTQLKDSDYETKDLCNIIEAYFTEDLDEAQRAEYLLKHRFNGATSRGDIRDAVYSGYIGNQVVATLEDSREFKAADITDIRKATCYAFADYLCKLAGDYVDISGNNQFEVFETHKSTLAPGITQEINVATMDDGKQVKFYIATADINSEYVNVYANYHNNGDALYKTESGEYEGWQMARVLDQANYAQNKYGNPVDKDGNPNPNYIPNYNVVASVNGAGYNMSTGEPSGLLVMNGVTYQNPNADGFFGILKNGKAVIGTTSEYNAVKGQVQEGIAAFGSLLIKDGKLVENLQDGENRASRTAVGITKTGKVVFLAVDGRQEPVSCGGTMREIAEMLLAAGCEKAVNLDGGGSTTFVAKQEGDSELSLVSNPSDGTTR